jgi:hypothetical protein
MSADILAPFSIDDTHIVVDALFPSKDSIKTAAALDVRLTWSQNANHQSQIHEALLHNLPKKKWRSVSVPQPESITQHYFVYNDSKAMMGGSTAFQIEEDLDEIGLLLKGCSPEIARDLARLDRNTLTWLIGKLPNKTLLESGASVSSMVTHITKFSPDLWAKSHPMVGRNVNVVCGRVSSFSFQFIC